MRKCSVNRNDNEKKDIHFIESKLLTDSVVVGNINKYTAHNSKDCKWREKK